MSSQTRLNKFLAERLGVSRREADDLIAAGQVTVDDQVATIGTKIDEKSKICYNKKLIPFETKYTYVAFNKPVGYVCSRRAQGPAPTLYDLLPQKYRKLKTVGRLDKDSSGLILLTNDGDFAYQMTHPKFRKEKVYEVELDKPLAPLHQQMISDFGVEIGDGLSRFTVIRAPEDTFFKDSSRFSSSEAYIPDATEKVARRAIFPGSPAYDAEGEKVRPEKGISGARYIAILSEGRNRQIRRTFAALGYEVVKLHRTQFGKYQLSALKPGHAQEINP